MPDSDSAQPGSALQPTGNGAKPRPKPHPKVGIALGGLDDTHQWVEPIRGMSPVDPAPVTPIKAENTNIENLITCGGRITLY